MNILILGTSGKLGNYIATNLFEKKYEIIAHVRNSKKRLNLNKNIKTVIFDIDSKFSKLNFDINSIDFIINCVAETKDIKLMYNANILFLKKFLDTFTKISKNKFTFLHFSTIGIYSKNKNKIISEDSTPKPSNQYERTKNESEKIIKSYSHKFKNMSYYIFRLGIVYGPTIQSNVINGLEKIASNNFYLKINNTNSPFIDIRDVLQFVELSISNKVFPVSNSYRKQPTNHKSDFKL